MRFIIRTFFKTLRLILGPLLLLREWLTRPKGMQREQAEQQNVDQQCRDMALYQYKTCPFCTKVRQEMRRLSLKIELLDAQHDATHRDALLQGGGQAKVPCLRITDQAGNTQWMYESNQIIEYLRGRFAAA